MAQQREQTAVTQVVQLGNENSADLKAQTAVSGVLLETGHPQQAAPFAEHAVALAPEDPDARLARAQVRFELKDYAGALKDAEKAVDVDPANQKARALAALLKKRVPSAGDGQPSPAAAAAAPTQTGPGPIPLRELEIPKPPPGASAEQIQSLALLRQAMVRDALGDHAAAAELAAKAAALDPRNAQALLQRAISLLALGRAEEAATAAGDAAAMGLKKPIVFVVRGLAHLRAKRPRKAAEDAERAMALDPDHAKAYWVRAQAREAMGWREEALNDFRRAKELSPDYTAEFEAAFVRIAGRPAPHREGEVRVPDGTRTNWLLAAGGLLAVLSLVVLLSRRPPETAPGLDSSQAGGGATPGSKNYRVGPVLGQGGMGTVYEGVDLKLGRKVALKRLRPELRRSPKEYARFLTEARIVASLRHPNVVEIHGIEEGEDTVLVFELVPGRSLDKLLEERGGRLAPVEALAVLGPVAEAVDYAHGRDVAHLDLKPSNVMVEPDGRIKVMDFGIARKAKDSLNALTGTALGTPLYMAPEQEEGKGGPASDRFALAAMAYELLAGAPPFPTGSFSAKREARFEDPRAKRPELPPGLLAFFRKALDPDPAKRFRNARGMVEELRGLLARAPA